MRKTSYKIAIIGPKTSLGSALLTLLEEHHFPPENIYPLDAHQYQNTFLPYGDGFLKVEALDTFRFDNRYIAVLCTDSILSAYKEEAIQQGSWLIDCTGRISSAPVVMPEINPEAISRADKRMISSPTAAAGALSLVLTTLQKKFKLLSCCSTGIYSAGEIGFEASDTLFNQSRCIYTQRELPSSTFHKPLAFNLIPELIPKLSTLTIQQIHQLTHAPIFFSSCFAPVFQGQALSLSFLLPQSTRLKCVERVLSRTPRCRLITQASEGFTLSPMDILTEDDIYITSLQADADTIGLFHAWILSDNLRTGTALNAVHLIKLLLS